MSRGERALAATGILLLGACALATEGARVPARETVVSEGCRTPLSVIETQREGADAAAVVFHGLAGNRRVMQILGQSLASAGLRVYQVDLPGHGDSREPFSFARAETCAAEVLRALERRGELKASRTVLVGHSMGGAVAVRLADRFPALATIALSPAPLVLPRRMPANLLVVSAEFDLAPLDRVARELERAAAGERHARQDFLERRAMEFTRMPRATHTSLIFDPRAAALASRWALLALDRPAPAPPAFPSVVLAGAFLGIVGLMATFPLAASLLSSAFHRENREPAAARPAAGRSLLEWSVAALFAVGVLGLVVPLRMLQMYGADYLASFLFITGAVLLALRHSEARSALRFSLAATAAAAALGLVVVLAFGAWLNWQLTDAWPNAVRWQRFLPLVAISLPYFLAEELALGAAKGSRLRQLGRFLLLRSALWLALAFGVFALGSGQFLIVLLSMYLAMFSLLQWVGARAVRRRIGSAAAAGTFGAILAAWFLVVVFPIT